MHFRLRPIIASAVVVILYTAVATSFAAKTKTKRPVSQPTGTPAAPAGFTLELVARSPDIHSPASLCVAPDGKVFVGRARDQFECEPCGRRGSPRRLAD